MVLEITHLGSGSRGNATLLQSEESKVLIDCGFSGRQIERRLGQIDVDPKSIDAILLSHHHSDHVQGAEIFHRRHGAKLFANFTRVLTSASTQSTNVESLKHLSEYRLPRIWQSFQSPSHIMEPTMLASSLIQVRMKGQPWSQILVNQRMN